MHTDDETVDLLGYLSRLLRFWLPATLVALAVLAAGIGASFVTGNSPIQEPKLYHAKAHVMVQMTGSDTKNQGMQAEMLSQWMRTFVALQDVPLLMDDVAEEMGSEYPVEELPNITSVYWGGGSMLLAVNASASSEEDALKMSNGLTKALVKRAPEMLKLSKDQLPTMVQVEQAKITNADDVEAVPVKQSSNSLVMPSIGAALAAWLATAFILEARQARRNRRTAAPLASR